MRVRRLIPFLVAALLVALVPAAPADAAKAKRKLKPCTARGDTTWNRTTIARVYEVGSDDHVLYGCMYDTGKRRRLTSWFSCGCSVGDETPPTTWLTGRFVAIAHENCSPSPVGGSCSGTLQLKDVRTGRTIHTGGYPSDLVLRRDGSMAYVSGDQVIRSDLNGTKVVDQGPKIEPGSLAANGSKLYWTRDGVPRAAPFL